MSLRNLQVKRVWDCDPATFLSAFRRNCSLQRVSIHSVSGWVMIGTAEKLRIQSYCDRNRCTRGLLQKLDNEDGLSLRLSLYPMLLHATKPAWRMAPTAFLSALLSCKEAIGPVGHAKRMASSPKGLNQKRVQCA
jgi:hypothetical protein